MNTSVWLYYRHVVYTDRKAVTHLYTLRNLDFRTTRLLLRLQYFYIKFDHIAGENFIANTNTRNPPDIPLANQNLSVNFVFDNFPKCSLCNCFGTSKVVIFIFSICARN